MKANVSWIEDKKFLGATENGHSVVMEASASEGEALIGPSPMEMILMGMGGCTCIDVVMILEKMRQDVTDCRVRLIAERAAEPPRVFTAIHCVFKVSGNNLSLAKAKEAVRLSADKYCSASLMLGKTATITHEVILED